MQQRFWVSGALILLIVCATAGLIFLLLQTSPETTTRAPEPLRQVAVDVREVMPRHFTRTVEAYATVSPQRKGTISAQVSGPLLQRGLQTDPGAAVQQKWRSLITGIALSYHGGLKGNNQLELIGCLINDYRRYTRQTRQSI